MIVLWLDEIRVKRDDSNAFYLALAQYRVLSIHFVSLNGFAFDGFSVSAW